MDMDLLIIHCLHFVYLMLQKASLIFIEIKTLSKYFKRFKRACSKNKRLSKTEMIPLTYTENKYYKKQKVYYICKICKKGSGTDDDNKK